MRCKTVLNTKKPSKQQTTANTIQWERFGGGAANSWRLVESASRCGFCTPWTMGRADMLADSFIRLHRGWSCRQRAPAFSGWETLYHVFDVVSTISAEQP